MRFLINILFFAFLISCSNSRTYTEQNNRAYNNLKDLVNSKMFEIESNTARPMATNALMQLGNTNILGPGNTAGSINLIGNSNSLKVKGDTISAFLPYYGEQNFGGGTYGGNHLGIEFNDVPENYQVTFDDQKQRAEIKFKIDDEHRNGEQYNVYITLFKNYNSLISVQSSNRTSIEYSGSVKRIKEDKEAQ